MYYEIYIDALFIENLILDYFLLTLLRRFISCTTTRLRIFLAALVGSVSFCVLCGSLFLWTVYGMLISYLGTSMCMVVIGFGIKGLRKAVFVTGLLYGMSMFLGGVLLWLKETAVANYVPGWILCLISVVLLNGVGTLLLAGKKQKQMLCAVSLLYKGCVRKTVGLWDTGNLLWDPLHNKPVCIVDRNILKPQIEEEELIYQIPYRTVGHPTGFLNAVIVDCMIVELDGQKYVLQRPVLGLSDTSLSGDGSYHLILNSGIADR